MTELYIYLLGVFVVAAFGAYKLRSRYNKHKKVVLTTSDCVWCVVFLALSWVSILCFCVMWLQDHSDDVIINIEKKEKSDGNSD